MKTLDEAKLLREQMSEESRQVTLDATIAAQIQILERLLESNAGYVKSPLSYNACAGFLEQLKHHAPAAFRSNFVLDEPIPEGAFFLDIMYGTNE